MARICCDPLPEYPSGWVVVHVKNDVLRNATLCHVKSYGRHRPTSYRLDMLVTGQDNIWSSNMPQCRSCASLGAVPISVPGAASRLSMMPLASCGFNEPTKMPQTQPCCSRCYSPMNHYRSRFIPTMHSHDR